MSSNNKQKMHGGFKWLLGVLGLLVMMASLFLVSPVDGRAQVMVKPEGIETEKGKEEEMMSTSTKKQNVPQQQQQQQRWIWNAKTIIIPHDEKKHRGGEDAAAVSKDLLVVADGVGGWARQGVNPGLYSRQLTQTIVKEGPQLLHQPPRHLKTRLQELVHSANWLTAKDHLGSATCTVLYLNSTTSPNAKLQTLNVGDSGYSIHTWKENENQWKVQYASKAGQKQFNFPYQLGGKYGDQVADVADEQEHELPQNDENNQNEMTVYVVYSDGVSDNLYPRQFHQCLDTYVPESLGLAADCIARTAYHLGKDKTFDSPFAQGAKQSGKRYRGGKHDDITVIVAQVISTKNNEKEESKNNDDDDNKKLDYDDPYLQEPMFVYTGHVGTVQDLPSLADAMKQYQAKKKDGSVKSDDSSSSSSTSEGHEEL